MLAGQSDPLPTSPLAGGGVVRCTLRHLSHQTTKDLYKRQVLVEPRFLGPVAPGVYLLSLREGAAMRAAAINLRALPEQRDTLPAC